MPFPPPPAAALTSSGNPIVPDSFSKLSPIDGEGYEFKEMYPEFLEEAKKEGDKQAQTSFEYAMEAEKNHHEMYNEAKDAVKQGNDLPDRKIYVCSVCGHTTYDEAPDTCPVCGAKKERFDEIQ